MKLNAIDKIDKKKGDYLVLHDLGLEGISVSHQCKTAKSALHWLLNCGFSAKASIVKVVSLKELESLPLKK